jgi:hypothetical protein
MAGGKRLILTRHAEVKIHERGLRLSWIEKTVRDPLWTEPEPRDDTAERRFGKIDEFGGRTRRVVCVETETTIRVITATFDRGARINR